MGEAMEFGNRTDVVTILSETSEDDTLSWKYIVMCLGQAQLFAGIPQVSEHESPKGSQQQVNPTVHILWRGKLRPRIGKPVNIRDELTTSFLALVSPPPTFFSSPSLK